MRKLATAILAGLLLAACGVATDESFGPDVGGDSPASDIAVVDGWAGESDASAAVVDVLDDVDDDTLFADALADIVAAPDVVAELDAEDVVVHDAVADDIVSAPDALDAGPDVEQDALSADIVESPPTGPFGSIVGVCYDLSDELDSAAPSLWIDSYIFDGDPFDEADLDPDALEIFEVPNAGGSSKCSEVFSMEVMDDCLGADLYKTETEVGYVGDGSITDYVIVVGDERVGVSVTRAYRGPYVTDFTLDDAVELLTHKLQGINESSARVVPEDAWVKQILHVWTLHADWADTVATAWDSLDPSLQADTIVLITIELGSDFVVTDTCDD